MIQIYSPSNTVFSSNGDFVLSPCSCLATFNLNGVWSLEMVHPVDEKYSYIVENAVLSVDTPLGKNQLYRIYKRETVDTLIYVYAQPIFLDAANDCFLMDVRPTNKTGQQALDIMVTNKKYKAYSDIKTLSTAYYVQKNLIEAITSEEENSFIYRWGGEILYKNHEVYINHTVGQDRGMRVEFGFNLAGISETVNMDNVVTRIIPKAYNGYILPNNETVDSPNITKYPIVCTRVIEYEDIKLQDDCISDEKGYASLSALYEALRKQAKAEYQKGIDLPSITYDIVVADLSQSNEYKEFKDLLLISLGDTVHCKHRRLGIETQARCVSLEYDCITNSVKSLILGDYSPSYFDKLSSVYGAVSNVLDIKTSTLLADKVYGIINAMNTQLKYQKNIAQKQDVRAILFEDTDAKSPTYGAMCLGSLGFQIANKRTADNTDWDWTTAATADGIYADVITAGILQGIKLVGNIIHNGNNFYVDENGNLKCLNAKISGTISASTLIGNVITNGLNFIVDKDGNMQCINAKISGTISASSLIGNVISNGSNFSVDAKGNLKCTNAKISGAIDASTIVGSSITNGINFFVDKDGNMQCTNAKISGTITSSEIHGGRITGDTEINVGTDLHVGDDIYMGDQTYDIRKRIFFNDKNYISLSNGILSFYSGDCYIVMSSISSGITMIYAKKEFHVYVAGKRMLSFFENKPDEWSATTFINGPVDLWGDVYVHGNLTVSGTVSSSGQKSRSAKAKVYVNNSIDSVKSANSYFTDEGQITFNEDGRATILFDPIWMETVNTNRQYQIQLTPYCEVSPWIIEEMPDKCIIAGKPNTKVNWYVSALQRDYENVDVHNQEGGDNYVD